MSKAYLTHAATPMVLALSALSVAGAPLGAQQQHIRQPVVEAPAPQDLSRIVEVHIRQPMLDNSTVRPTQGDHSMSKLPNIVLVHGAWADGSSWSSVIRRLQQAGYHVAAVQLGLTSLDDDVTRTRALLAAQTGPTLLVAHSFGGAVITQLGSDAPNVIGLVYESAFAPAQGETLKGLLSQPPQPPGVAAIRPDQGGYVWLDPEGFLKFFAPDVPVARARVLATVQKPIAADVLFSEAAFGPPSWRSFPSWYLVTTEDQMLPPEAQQLFAKRMGATVTTLAASHAAMVSHPDAVASFIVKAATAAEAEAALAAH
jgi:pimeloyl-ACP methyl ester carboxylesterase